jgi:hypothetical protein
VRLKRTIFQQRNYWRPLYVVDQDVYEGCLYRQNVPRHVLSSELELTPPHNNLHTLTVSSQCLRHVAAELPIGTDLKGWILMAAPGPGRWGKDREGKGEEEKPRTGCGGAGAYRGILMRDLLWVPVHPAPFTRLNLDNKPASYKGTTCATASRGRRAETIQ